MKIYGPYRYKDRSGQTRLLINYYDDNGVKRSKSYPRYLMETHLGRMLHRGEDVDHVDRNPLNNDLSNLRILAAKENRGRHAPPISYTLVLCAWCSSEFAKETRRVKANEKQNRAGHFCNRKCVRAWQASPRAAIGRRV